ncbi:SH3 domain-containing protein [Fictibacillus sp. 18YEL24]|uniref:SH3 domain-containing protein n=1 Tax=Fictibacillus sp. 18YEL24 TaxID=2745875 RepID=UPI0018CCA9D9|nr:SH3 domain-containing protein [Fictibacillus sp. 18YEL24]MBH0169339.1 SH3 domain-containing protein [Fictibacillus sp. 18YEL24]
MNIKKRWVAGVLGTALTFGAVAGTTSAEGNVLLASVEWVNAQLNPMKTKVTSLETKVAQQQTEINQLREAIANGSTPPPATLPDKVYVSSSVAKIRSGATTEYKVLAEKPYGSTLSVIDKFESSNGLWYRVTVSSTVKGWIYTGDVSTTQVSAPTKVVTTAKVNIRKGATNSYDVVATVSSGTTLKYLSSFTNDSGETWYNVQTSSGVKGWMISTYGEVK